MVIVEVYGFSVMVINQWFNIKCTNIKRRKAPEYYYCEGCCSTNFTITYLIISTCTKNFWSFSKLFFTITSVIERYVCCVQMWMFNCTSRNILGRVEFFAGSYEQKRHCDS